MKNHRTLRISRRIFFCASLIAFPLLSVGCNRQPQQGEDAGQKSSNAKQIWTCSMHTQIREDHPGNCPLCGMALVPLHSHEEMLTSNSIAAPSQTPAVSAMTNIQKAPEMSASAEAVIHLDDARSSVASIQTTPVEKRFVQRKIELFGEIAYINDRHLDYTWYFSGRVQKVLIDYNTTEVSAGEAIMKVYSEEAIAEQRAYLETLRQRWLATFYERRNFDAQLGSIRERLSQIGITDADFKNLEKTGTVQSEFIIRAPKAGSILGGLPHAGERFTADKVLFHLAPLEDVWFVADVYEQDLALLKLGQQISIKCPAHPDEAFHGKLVYIDREVDPQKRTIKARFLVPNPNRMLLPQLSATGLLEMGATKSLLAVPASAVIDTGKRQLVYVEKSPHTYELRPVKIGPEGEIPNEGTTRWVSVTKGLDEGEKVVSAGAFLIDAEAQMQGLPASRGDAPAEMTPDRQP
jgi:Cu(I)/Ag(I) efflux system membrane fusion protein